MLGQLPLVAHRPAAQPHHFAMQQPVAVPYTYCMDPGMAMYGGAAGGGMPGAGLSIVGVPRMPMQAYPVPVPSYMPMPDPHSHNPSSDAFLTLSRPQAYWPHPQHAQHVHSLGMEMGGGYPMMVAFGYPVRTRTHVVAH